MKKRDAFVGWWLVTGRFVTVPSENFRTSGHPKNLSRLPSFFFWPLGYWV
jgi:hypothetical protein